MMLNSSVQGASHIKTGKECQDYSLVWEDSYQKLKIAAVSDGHGSERHFRSAIGAKLACEAAMDTLREIGSSIDAVDLKNSDLQAQISRCICSRWIQAVETDIATQGTDVGIEAYGCTLIAYLQTSRFWVSLQIGDGLCVILNRRNYFRKPIKWDDRCVCGFTTSMCDKNAANEFRFASGLKRSIPKAVFLSSDGVDGTFGCKGELYVFYWNILKSFLKDGYEKVKEDLPVTLSHFSEVGSRDDMSLAIIINKIK